MSRRSRIWDIPKKEFQNLLDNSNSYSEILEKLNYDSKTGGAYKTIIKRINEEEFSLEILNQNRNNYYQNNIIKKQIPINEVLVVNSNYPRHTLKTRLIKNNILEYKCSLCSLKDIWNGEKISLQLDHINGINNDNRIENLRFLCPNCHSQTATYSGKKNKKQLDSYTKIKRKRKFEITKDDLINLIKQYPMTKVGELLGVSDNAVRKRCITLGIDYKKLRNVYQSHQS